MSKKISELPLYTGLERPVGDIPISILGTTYRIPAQIAAGASGDFVSPGTGVSFTGTGTQADPKVINASGSGTTPNLQAVLLQGDIPFEEANTNSVFDLTQRGKYLIFSNGIIDTVTLDDATVNFPVYSTLRFQTYDHDLIFNTTEDVRYLGSSITTYTVKPGDIATLYKITESPSLWLFSISVKSVPQGKISLQDFTGAVFTDLAGAQAYIAPFNTSGGITDESFADGVYRFTAIADTNFGGANGFCGDDTLAQNLEFKDPLGLVTVFNTGAFFGNVRNNVLGAVTAGQGFFKGANPEIKNTIKSLVVVDIAAFNNYTGRLDISVSLGTDATATLPSDIFTTSNLCSVHVPLKLKYNNAGGTEDGDLANIRENAITTGNANSVITFD